VTSAFAVGASVTVTATLLLLSAERAGSRRGRMATKPVASLGFLLSAVGAGATETLQGRLLFAGLVLSFVGDVLLIAHSEKSFLAGLGSFLLGHAAFAAGFLARGVSWPVTAGAAFASLAFVVPVWRWLAPHLGPDFRVPVLAYVSVITAMVALSAGTFATSRSLPLLVGAVLFAVSDVSVARDRFVEEALSNKLWGLPLYYAAQLLIAYGAA